MRIKPRTQILDVWRSLLSASYNSETAEWAWASGGESNSITDAEQLLCLLHPMNEIDAFALSDQEIIQPDVANALAPMGGVRKIPRAVVDITLGYFARHTQDGQPRFTGGSSFRPAKEGAPGATKAQKERFEVVDSYSMSVTLCLAVLAFVVAREPLESNTDYKAKLASLRSSASVRLTAAMTGLLRSFVVNAIDPDSDPGKVVLSMLRHRQPDLTDEALHNRVQARFSRLRAQLHSDVRLAVPEDAKPEEDQLFECGWSWGIAEDARPVTFVQEPPEDGDGSLEDFVKLDIASSTYVADARPYLYFTVVALDGIVDLFARRTRELNLFNPVQLRLAEALQIRWDLTQRYWSTVARFDREQWPLEDIPWRTSDGEESDYYSLLVTSVLVQDLIARQATENDLSKAISILEDLASRGRITRRMTGHDAAFFLHAPGVPMRLLNSNTDGPPLTWYTYDYAPLLLKRACQAVQLTNNVQSRERLMAIAEAAMDQLASRQIATGPAAGLWDDVSRLTREARVPAATEPSWYLTERVIEGLVTAAGAYSQSPPRSDRMLDHLIRLVNEADHLYNQELMATDVNDRSPLRTGLDSIELLISQAREIAERQTGTAIALALQALTQLEGLAQGRLDPRRGR